MEKIKTTTLNKNIETNHIGSKKWISRLDGVIQKNVDDIYLDNNKIANELQISERQLFRKVKELTDLTPQKYLKMQRLKKAMKFLKNGKYRTVKETAKAVGYTKSNYFSTQFKNQFGKKPLVILRELGWR
ncbi:MAG: helix-turn-helix domain-containing protein [Saprospiraceae bacterium]